MERRLRVVRQHLVRDLAMCCGGAMEVAITPAEPSRSALEALVASELPRALVTPLDGGPLSVRDTNSTGDPRLHQPVVKGDDLIEVIGVPERAIVFGLGHVGRALGPLLAELDFEVIACDDGETGGLQPTPSWAARVIESFDPAEVERAIGSFTVDDYVLIVTRDHAIDQTLARAARRPR